MSLSLAGQPQPAIDGLFIRVPSSTSAKRESPDRCCVTRPPTAATVVRTASQPPLLHARRMQSVVYSGSRYARLGLVGVLCFNHCVRSRKAVSNRQTTGIITTKVLSSDFLCC